MAWALIIWLRNFCPCELPSRPVKERQIPLQFLVLEEAERRVPRPVALHDGGRMLPPGGAVGLDSQPFGHQGPVCGVSVLHRRHFLVDRRDISLQRGFLVAQGLHRVLDGLVEREVIDGDGVGALRGLIGHAQDLVGGIAHIPDHRPEVGNRQT